MLPFDGKTALVTGGCSGIGYATVMHYLEQGVKNIAILDLHDPKNITQSLQDSYSSQKVIFIKTDVSKKEQVESAFSEVVSQFEFIDFVVAAAGILREKDYELTINVNVLGAFHTTYIAIDAMSKEKDGRGGIITTISSVAALDTFYSIPSYSASKSAVLTLNGSFSNEFYFNKHGIKFITICPSFTKTALLDDLEKKLTEGTFDATVQVMESTGSQTADSVGRCISEIVNLAKNGSVWIVDDGKMREITLNKYFLPKL